ncbi:lytic murein transglycosylase, partial [Sandarakinorhabdus sp.]|uniref:lytic murein transglycosylase n=1 Tax=Sandarakinorhabdus sp. TaxID=1916663 RepID=UPI00286E966C
FGTRYTMRVFLALLLLLLPSLAHADEGADALAFNLWLANYRADAITRGIKPEWLDAGLAGVTFQPRVIGHDRTQPGSAGRPRTFPEYLAGKFHGDRIPAGQRRFAEHRAALMAAEQASGVPAATIASIWGIESSYGRVIGTFDLPSALATLAYEGRRRALFTAELDAAVKMVGEAHATRAQMRGSWAGAFGQTQFLPTSYLRNGRDGDGDGRVDLWNSLPDVFQSIGEYLKQAGWKRGETWGFRAIVPAGANRADLAAADVPQRCVQPISRHSRLMTASEWRARGFVAVNAAWPDDNALMSLIEPDGPGQGAFLVTQSYRAILGYNCSNLYALSVGLLGDAIAAP